MSHKEFVCAMKGCKNKRFNGRYFCEEHWKGRRLKKSYKDRWEND